MRAFILLILLLLAGCRSAPPKPTPSATPQKSLLQQADEMLAAQDFEGAAVAYRDVLDQMEESDVGEGERQEVREKATRAMTEAGGFASSQRVWQEMGEKNPDSKMEAGRMKARAERMMLQQGEELLAQAAVDKKEGHRSKALATALATESLFQKAGASEEQKERVAEFLRQLEK